MTRNAFFFLVVCSFLTAPLLGQRANPNALRYEDYVYQPNIRSVQFYVEGLVLSYPVLDLNGGSTLLLAFDDLDGDVKNYYYRFIHCDMNWKPSDISEMEYLDGFSEERIFDYQFSSKTVSSYTHYTLQLPNNSMRWKLSGNYLLAVYPEGNASLPAITRRFVVADPKVQISSQFVRPNQVNKIRTHQEIDFTVNHEKFLIRNPQQEIKAVILQNGRWDQAITGVTPLFFRANQLVFDYQDVVVFPGGKEFRQLDLRSLRSRLPQVASVDSYRDRIEVSLQSERSRGTQPYLEYNDINGKFVIETQDQNNPLAANYAQVLFSLSVDAPFYDDDLYVVGAFSDWQLKKEFQMAYNNAVNAYVLKTPLKQGFYDYAYAMSPRSAEKKAVNLSPLEGDWFETENDYTLLIYYRPFGGRYDQVIGMSQINSRGQ